MSDDFNEAAENVINTALELKKEGLVIRTWGNISERSGQDMVITPSGKAYESLRPCDMAVVTIDSGEKKGPNTPSSEYLIHLITYRNNPDVNFVIHTHQPAASALSVLGHDLEDDMVRDFFPEISAIPCAGYGLNGSRELMDNIGDAENRYPESSLILMKNHGALIFGHDEKEAFSRARTLEDLSEKIYKKMTGYDSERTFSDLILDGSYREKLDGESLDPLLKGLSLSFDSSPVLKEYAKSGRIMYPYLDDLAQIAGVKIPVYDSLEGDAIRSLVKYQAILIKEKGAYCIGSDDGECESTCMVLEKAAYAALIGEKYMIDPIKEEYAFLDRKVYVESYSKKK